MTTTTTEDAHLALEKHACAACGAQAEWHPGKRALICPFCGTEVLARASEERRLITVLFADLVGYTAWAERMDPERVRRLVDAAFERLIDDIVGHGGTVDKVLGDGLLALFGVPATHEDDPARALCAAIEMHASVFEMNTAGEELPAEIQLRVGVNTGEVLVGVVSGTDDYTAMGDVVNLTHRLQAMAPPGDVYVGDATARLAGVGHHPADPERPVQQLRQKRPAALLAGARHLGKIDPEGDLGEGLGRA